MKNKQTKLILLVFTACFIFVSCSEDKKSPTENTNTAPYFSSVPDTTALTDEEYNYEIVAVDQEGNAVTIAAPLLPEWLIFTDNGDGTAVLSGVPNSEHVGEHPVKLTVTDGIISNLIEQSFVITVELSESGGGLIDIEENFDFYLGIMPFEIYERGFYFIIIQSFDYNLQIESVELTINGSAVDLNQDGYDVFYFYHAEILLNQGNEVSYEVSINGTDYSGILTIPYQPQNATFPAEFMPTQSYNLTWDLVENSQYQLFEVYGYNWDDDEEDGEYKELSPSARSFTIPANWVNSGFEYYDIALSEFSANWNGKFIAVAFDGAWAPYGEEWKTNQQKMRERILTLTKVIQK